MKEEKEDQAGLPAGRGESANAGESFNPTELKEEKSLPDKSERRSVPIGRSVSEAEYDRLKKRAERGTAPSVGHAQEDPSHRD